MSGASNLIIIEKYDLFVNYIYPVLQNIQRKHGVVKERVLLIIFEQTELFLASWGGHIKSANSHNLVQFIKKELQKR